MSKRDQIIAILREWHWDGGTEAVADRILACVAEPSIVSADEAAIRARADHNSMMNYNADRRTLLAELDRLRGILDSINQAQIQTVRKWATTADGSLAAGLLEPTEAMVEAAAKVIHSDGWDAFMEKNRPKDAEIIRRVARTKARDVLVAAGKAMVQP